MATSAKGKAKLLATELLFVIVYSIYTGSRSLSRLFSRLVNRVKSTYDVAATEVDLGLVDVMNFNINHEQRENDAMVSTILYLYYSHHLNADQNSLVRTIPAASQ